MHRRAEGLENAVVQARGRELPSHRPAVEVAHDAHLEATTTEAEAEAR